MNSLIRLATINPILKKSCWHSRLQWPYVGVSPPSKKATPVREALISFPQETLHHSVAAAKMRRPCVLLFELEAINFQAATQTVAGYPMSRV